MAPADHDAAPLPSFLIIGAERSATRWLRFNLDRHPQVFAPPIELNWFNDVDTMRARGSRWYQLQFDTWRDEPVLGESSPAYLKRISRPELVAERIHRRISDARLVAIVRDPVERFQSAVRMYIKRGRLPADVEPIDLVRRGDPLVDELDLIGAGLYSACLYPYRQRFGEQLLVLDHADIVDRPVEVYERVLRHVGADPGFVPPDLDRVRFSDRSTISLPELTDAQRRLIYMAFRLDVEELEAMLDWDLSAWDPGPPSADQAADVVAVLRTVPLMGPPPERTDLEPSDQDDPDEGAADQAAPPAPPDATARAGDPSQSPAVT
jgi:hypothetical protein